MPDRRLELKNIIMDTKTLPALPVVVTKLNALAEDERASIQEMARIINSDQVIAARVLKLANSPAYGFYRVATISNAIILLGIKVVKSLALSSSMFAMMETDNIGLWEHSLGVGAAAGLIARKLGLPEGEEIATAGLLHDIGKIIVRIKCPDAFNSVLECAQVSSLAMRDAEREILGADHCEIGEWLSTCWLLPDKLREPIACHHEVDRAVNQRIKTSVVHLADVLVKASGFGDSGDDLVPRIQQTAWDVLRLTDNHLRAFVDELEDTLVEVKNFSREMLA